MILTDKYAEDGEWVNRIGAQIILQAVNDLDFLFSQVMKIRKMCSNRKIDSYVAGLASKGFKGRLLLERYEEYHLPDFFGSDRWGKFLFDYFGIHSFPEDLRDKVLLIESFRRHCLGCLTGKRAKARHELRRQRRVDRFHQRARFPM
jgi:hypothetical protein